MWIERINRFCRTLGPRGTFALFLTIAVISAIPVAVLMHLIIAGFVPDFVPAVALTTALIVSGPLIAHGVHTTGSLERKKARLTATRAELDARLSELARMHERLSGLNDELEERVQERTAELERARKAAVTANKAKSMFLANMSHELRTPLNAILGFSDLLMRRQEFFGEDASAVVDNYMASIHQSGNHLLSLVDDLLDVSSVETGRYEVFPERIALAYFVEDAVSHLRRASRDFKNQTIAIDIEDGADIWADRRALQRILQSTVSNVLRVSEDGAHIAVRAIREPGACVLTVEGEARGGGADCLADSFEPFARLGNAMTAQEDGVGLGLAIAKSLADLHGAELTLHSTPGDVTDVSLRFFDSPQHRAARLKAA